MKLTITIESISLEKGRRVLAALEGLNSDLSVTKAEDWKLVAQKALLDQLNGNWRRGEDLSVSGLNLKTTKWVLAHMHRQGQIDRDGEGKKGRPYVYRRKA